MNAAAGGINRLMNRPASGCAKLITKLALDSPIPHAYYTYVVSLSIYVRTIFWGL